MIRTGIGYDIHKLQKGENLIIGGINIPSIIGSVGHSDGDCLIHAIIDAMLGAANLGDIGKFFPSSDDNLKNASSCHFLEKTVQLIEQSGFQINNIDTTIVLQKPQLRLFIPQIIKNLSIVMNLPQSQISVKATTADGLGFIGKELGWSVLALATLLERT